MKSRVLKRSAGGGEKERKRKKRQREREREVETLSVRERGEELGEKNKDELKNKELLN